MPAAKRRAVLVRLSITPEGGRRPCGLSAKRRFGDQDLTVRRGRRKGGKKKDVKMKVAPTILLKIKGKNFRFRDAPTIFMKTKELT
jgi:hypothetical protein